MPDDRDPMDVEGAIRTMNAALVLQYRSALAYTLAAGSLTGFEFQPITRELAAFGQAELDDARRLIEKIVTLEGEPTDDPAAIAFERDPKRRSSSSSRGRPRRSRPCRRSSRTAARRGAARRSSTGSST